MAVSGGYSVLPRKKRVEVANQRAVAMTTGVATSRRQMAPQRVFVDIINEMTTLKTNLCVLCLPVLIAC